MSAEPLLALIWCGLGMLINVLSDTGMGREEIWRPIPPVEIFAHASCRYVD